MESNWITDRDPPLGPRTYLTSCQNADGAVYVACHYWFKSWGSAGPFVKVLGWMEAPMPLMSVQISRELELTRVYHLRDALAQTAHQPAQCGHCQALIRGAYQALFRDDRVARGEC